MMKNEDVMQFLKKKARAASDLVRIMRTSLISGGSTLITPAGTPSVMVFEQVTHGFFLSDVDVNLVFIACAPVAGNPFSLV